MKLIHLYSGRSLQDILEASPDFFYTKMMRCHDDDWFKQRYLAGKYEIDTGEDNMNLVYEDQKFPEGFSAIPSAILAEAVMDHPECLEHFARTNDVSWVNGGPSRVALSTKNGQLIIAPTESDHQAISNFGAASCRIYTNKNALPSQ